jgi:CheY-like chemotaxis protein
MSDHPSTDLCSLATTLVCPCQHGRGDGDEDDPTFFSAQTWSEILEQTSIVEVLLVEDTPTDAELCLRALRKHKLANNVHWVKDGAQAIDFLFPAGGALRSTPRVILLDLKLPRADGLEVLRKLKSDENTKTIPVVVLTSSTEDCDIAEAYRLGANSFISKPVEFSAFSDVVAKLGMYWLIVNQPIASARV